MITYQLDEHNIYIYKNPDLQSQPMHSVIIEPPDINAVFLVKWVTDLSPVDINFGLAETGKWVVLADHRQEKFYVKSDGTEYSGDEYDGVGDIPDFLTNIKPPSKYHSWDESDWVLTPEKQQKLKEEELATAKTAKLFEINNNAQAFINTLASLNEVPDFEVRTWVKQAQEAYAWEQNKDAPTPTLDLIALGRGIDRVLLVEKALQKAKQFDSLVGYTAGLRQGYEDALKVATSVEAINSINPVYSVPTI